MEHTDNSPRPEDSKGFKVIIAHGFGRLTSLKPAKPVRPARPECKTENASRTIPAGFQVPELTSHDKMRLNTRDEKLFASPLCRYSRVEAICHQSRGRRQR